MLCNSSLADIVSCCSDAQFQMDKKYFYLYNLNQTYVTLTNVLLIRFFTECEVEIASRWIYFAYLSIRGKVYMLQLVYMPVLSDSSWVKQWSEHIAGKHVVYVSPQHIAGSLNIEFMFHLSILLVNIEFMFQLNIC